MSSCGHSISTFIENKPWTSSLLVSCILENTIPSVRNHMRPSLRKSRTNTVDFDKKELVKLLLTHKAQVDFKDLNGCTPLYGASQVGHLVMAQNLIDHGANANAAAYDGSTPLIVASSNGENKLVKLLLKYKAEFNYKGSDGMTALLEASKKGFFEIARMLIVHGADHDTPLIVASRNGWGELVSLLITNGPHTDITDMCFLHPTHIAAQKGHLEVLVKLNEHNCDLHALSRMENTPLHFAVKNHHKDVVKWLILNGDDP